MTDPNLEQARKRYQETEVPQELPFAVASALRRGERQRTRSRTLRRSLSGVVAACICFVLLVNTSPTFATACAEVPVLGSLLRVFTVVRLTEQDETKYLDVRQPALEDTGYTDLEAKVNGEIQARIDLVLAEARTRAEAYRQAFLETGGSEADFIPVTIDVDYEVTCQTESRLSFILTCTETQANTYTQFYPYNIDLETGTEISLEDLLGANWKERCNNAIRAEIVRRQEEDSSKFYFDGSEGVDGFQSVSDNQRFFLNEAGNPVVLFEKYEIAPGYMGQQEFEIPQ